MLQHYTHHRRITFNYCDNRETRRHKKGWPDCGATGLSRQERCQKLGPWTIPLANILFTVLKLSAAVLSWLASNQWFIYDYMKESLALSTPSPLPVDTFPTNGTSFYRRVSLPVLILTPCSLKRSWDIMVAVRFFDGVTKPNYNEIIRYYFNFWQSFF